MEELEGSVVPAPVNRARNAVAVNKPSIAKPAPKPVATPKPVAKPAPALKPPTTKPVVAKPTPKPIAPSAPQAKPMAPAATPVVTPSIVPATQVSETPESMGMGAALQQWTPGGAWGAMAGPAGMQVTRPQLPWRPPTAPRYNKSLWRGF
jgi:hypothetical protein